MRYAAYRMREGSNAFEDFSREHHFKEFFHDFRKQPDQVLLNFRSWATLTQFRIHY